MKERADYGVRSELLISRPHPTICEWWLGGRSLQIQTPRDDRHQTLLSRRTPYMIISFPSELQSICTCSQWYVIQLLAAAARLHCSNPT